MQDSMYKYMKVGIIHFMAYPSVIKGEGPVAETLAKIAADDYFTAVEITWIKDLDEKEKAKAILRASHLAVGYGAQPAVLTTGLNPNVLDEAERKKAVDVLKREVDSAYEMGAGRMAFLSGKDPGEADREKAKEQLVRTIRELCDYAVSKGDLGITLETFDRTVDKKSLIGPSDEAAQLAAEVNRRNFGLMIDLSHLPLQNETIEQAIANVRDHLVHVHIGNCVMGQPDHAAYGDQHPRFGIEGGENDVPEVAAFLRALLRVGFLNPCDRPFMSFEVKPVGDEPTELVIANAKRTLNEAWAMV